MSAAPSRAALVALCALVALGGAFTLALYALTVPDQRDELLTLLLPALAGVAAGVPGLLGWLNGHKLAKAQGERLDGIEHNTNGHLTQRLQDVRDGIVTDVLAALNTNGQHPSGELTGPTSDAPPEWAARG